MRKIKRRNEILTIGKRRRAKLEEFAVIYITGDTHGETARFHSPEIKKVGKGDTLLICGDFGFLWDGGPAERKAIKKLGSRKYTVAFVDGTHENFDLLATYPVVDWNGGKAQHICGNLYHLMRGQVYEIEGKKVFAFGGGESDEKQLRIRAGKWWPCEMPSRDEMRAGLENLRAAGFTVDYIVTHEPPPGVEFGSFGSENRTPLELFFMQVLKQVAYQKWFFGSRHIDRRITSKNYAVFSRILPAEDPPPRRRLFGR